MKFPFRLKVFAVLLLLVGCPPSYSQADTATGSIEVTGRPKIGTKQEMIVRKRFYLLRGGLEANKTLIERLKASDVLSRDCFYCQMQVSPEYLAWLKAENCESAYCREIKTEDITKIPEFKAAYQKGLTQYGNKPSIAKKWLTTNLETKLRDGFYEQRKSLIAMLLGGIRPIQSAITDSVNLKAVFIDVALKGETGGKATETLLISNLVPIEIGEKSYIWACEVEVGSEERATLKLQIPEKDKPVKKCEVIIKQLPICGTESCAKK